MTRVAAQHPLASTDPVRATVEDLRSLSIRALKRMYRPEAGLFAFRLQRHLDGERPEGVSERYTAIVLIGLIAQTRDISGEVLDGEDVYSLCGRLLDRAPSMENMGDVALTLWAAVALHHPDAQWCSIAFANCSRSRRLIRPWRLHGR